MSYYRNSKEDFERYKQRNDDRLYDENDKPYLPAHTEEEKKEVKRIKDAQNASLKTDKKVRMHFNYSVPKPTGKKYLSEKENQDYSDDLYKKFLEAVEWDKKLIYKNETKPRIILLVVVFSILLGLLYFFASE
tara:strand:+ start:108 stop:506 length:399 start_codon:yes stop_codon:yes gene_type:complete